MPSPNDAMLLRVCVQAQARAEQSDHHHHRGDEEGEEEDEDGGKEAEESPQRRVEDVQEFQIELSP